MNGETETNRRKSGTTCTQHAIFSATKEKSDRRRRFGHAEEIGREQPDLQARHSVPRIQDSSAAGADGQEDDPGAAHHEHQEKRHQQRIRVWQGHCKRHDHHSDRLGERVPVHQGCEHQQKDQRCQEIEDDSDDQGCNSKGATSSVKSTRETVVHNSHNSDFVEESSRAQFDVNCKTEAHVAHDLTLLEQSPEEQSTRKRWCG